MKQRITPDELALLDVFACTADKLQELVDYVGRARPHVAGLICRLLEVADWDHDARQAIERFVAAQPECLESLLGDLGVVVGREHATDD